MGLKKITLTEDHIKLISNMEIRFDEEFKTFCFDLENPYGRGDDKYTDMALILDDFDKREIVDGNITVYPDDILEKMDKLDEEIVNNFDIILDILVQNAGKVLESGTYKTKTNFRNWEKK